MRGPYQILLPLLGLFLVRVDLTDLFPISLPVKVLEIVDGDTLLVKHRSLKYKVRLSKVDSPEKGQRFLSSNKDAGAFAKECLKGLMNAEVYDLKYEKQDIYGRVLGDLDGLSLRIIEEGCASLYPYSQFASREEKHTYLLALKKARSMKKGLWRYGGFRQPKLWRKSNKRSGHRR